MNPSVGRTVHYVARGSADGVFPAVCRSAIITEVQPRIGSRRAVIDVERIGVAVINPTGLFFHSLADGGCTFDAGNPADEAVGARCSQGDRAYTGGTWHYPERVETLAAGPVTFLVNTRPVTMASSLVTYEEISNLANIDPARIPTVEYSRAVGPKAEGSLHPGESVEVGSKTIIDCAVTGSA